MTTIDRLLKLQCQMNAAREAFYDGLFEAGYVRFFVGNMVCLVHPDYELDVRLAEDSLDYIDLHEYLESLPNGVVFFNCQYRSLKHISNRLDSTLQFGEKQ